MRFAGIDVGADRHIVAIVGEEGEVLCRYSPFSEDAAGYRHLSGGAKMTGSIRTNTKQSLHDQHQLSVLGIYTPVSVNS